MIWILTPRWIGKLRTVAIALDNRNLSLSIGATLVTTLADLDLLCVSSVFSFVDIMHISILLLIFPPRHVYIFLIVTKDYEKCFLYYYTFLKSSDVFLQYGPVYRNSVKLQ
jgi:hypothetical protein